MSELLSAISLRTRLAREVTLPPEFEGYAVQSVKLTGSDGIDSNVSFTQENQRVTIRATDRALRENETTPLYVKIQSRPQRPVTRVTWPERSIEQQLRDQRMLQPNQELRLQNTTDVTPRDFSLGSLFYNDIVQDHTAHQNKRFRLEVTTVERSAPTVTVTQPPVPACPSFEEVRNRVDDVFANSGHIIDTVVVDDAAFEHLQIHHNVEIRGNGATRLNFNAACGPVELVERLWFPA